MSKISLTNLVNLQNETTAVNAINANNAVLTTAMEKTLSRDGTTPNTMGATLDMNSHRIINLPAADSGDQPATKSQLDAIGNGYLGNNILVGTNNEINVSSAAGTTTFSLPSSLTLTGKTLTNGAFAGTTTAPTATLGTNTTQLATTAFVLANAASAVTTNLPFILAWQNGVPGDTGADLTIPLQTLITNAPSGSTIYFRGAVNSTFLDLSGKKNITLKSADVGSYAPAGGYTERATLIMNTGAVGAGVPAIKCWNTQSVAFEGMSFYAPNVLFNGTLISWGPDSGSTTYSFLPKMRDCVISAVPAASTGMNMNASTNGSFRDLEFGGAGCHLKLQDDSFALVGFVNCHLFDTCSFLPSGVVYPVQGSCNGCVFLNCLWEPCSDAKIRAFLTSSNRPFTALTIINPTIIDATVGGNEAFVFQWGDGLTIIGGTGGAPPVGYLFALGGGGIAHLDPEVRGLRGVNITGFAAQGCTALMDFYGTKANKTNVRGITVSGNSVLVGDLLGPGYPEVENGEFGPNNIYAGLNKKGSAKFYVGWPTYVDRAAAVAAGFDTGQMFIASGSLNALQVV